MTGRAETQTSIVWTPLIVSSKTPAHPMTTVLSEEMTSTVAAGEEEASVGGTAAERRDGAWSSHTKGIESATAETPPQPVAVMRATCVTPTAIVRPDALTCWTIDAFALLRFFVARLLHVP